LDKNPTFATEYKSDNLTSGDVLVKTAKRYRVLAYTDLFDIEYSSDYSSTQVYSNVDGALASALNTVISDKLPIAAFDTAHSEKLDMSAYKKLLTSNSFETKDFSLLTDKIPDNAQMIVLGYPTTDCTDAEISKLDEFLKSKTISGDRSLMVTFYPGQSSMPKLSAFLKEWGLEVSSSEVAETDSSKYLANNPGYILSNIQTTLSLEGKSTDYGYFFTPVACPVNILFETKGTKTTYSLAKSNDTTYQADSSTDSSSSVSKAAYNTAALSQDTITSGEKTYKANVIAMGSSLMFSDGVINASTFGNGKYIAALSKYATGTSNTDTEISVDTKQTNVQDITLSSVMSTFLGLGIFTVAIPLMIAIAGVIVYHRRRHL
jgi:ABC-2 type transport system permease protein